jgi:hypothetical protein
MKALADMKTGKRLGPGFAVILAFSILETGTIASTSSRIAIGHQVLI